MNQLRKLLTASMHSQLGTAHATTDESCACVLKPFEFRDIIFPISISDTAEMIKTGVYSNALPVFATVHLTHYINNYDCPISNFADLKQRGRN